MKFNKSADLPKAEMFEGNLFLIGFMGAGKSTVSKAMSERFGLEIIEMDERIAKDSQMSIPEIFATRGEEYFREQETDLLRSLYGIQNKIVSCGGGVAMRSQNVEEMKKSGTIVLLTARPETILARVQDSHDRPLLEGNKTVEHISALMDKRKDAYYRAADLIIETDGKNTDEICDEIAAALLKSKSF